MALCEAIAADGGLVLTAYREPLGGKWLLLASLPIERVEPTPYQRDLSEAHTKRLASVMEKLGRFLDPVIVIRTDSGRYQTPNGHHRLAAAKKLGARAVLGLVVPEPEVAFQILALNTEKAHNLREKALEVARMYRTLAALDARLESAFALEFEEPAFVTLGLCYEQRPRFSGGAYQPLVRRVEAFLEEPLAKALPEREQRAKRILALDDRVAGLVEKLKEQGLRSPYLKAFVVARLNPLRFRRDAKMTFEQAMALAEQAAEKFAPEKIRPQDLAVMGPGTSSPESDG